MAFAVDSFDCVAQLLSVGHMTSLTKLIFSLTVTLLAMRSLGQVAPLPPPILSITDLGNGYCQIVSRNLAAFHQIVLLETTDFAVWTPISTNSVPPPPNAEVTNIVQKTNFMVCFRVVEQ